ncbi:hypothetical protein [Dokdonia sp.]|uniref:hypothetical protein n=1 Tax=Dokdonia sp. TaxID=2024995 RepID=UPI003263825B
MNNIITYRLQVLSRINTITIDQKELVFQIQGYLSYVNLHTIIGVLPHFPDKNIAYLRTGLSASLGFTLIGLIYKTEKFTSTCTIHSQYAFAKAYQTFNPFCEQRTSIHQSLNKHSKITLL